jgi:hypothetical protein
MADDDRYIFVINEMAVRYDDIQAHLKLKYTTPAIYISDFGRTNGKFITSTIVIWKRWIEPDIRIYLQPTGPADDYGRSIEVQVRVRHLPTQVERFFDLTAVHLPRSNDGSDKAATIGSLIPPTKQRPHVVFGDINTKLNDVRRYLPPHLTAHPLAEAEVVVAFVRYRFGSSHPSSSIVLAYAGVEVVHPTCAGGTIDYAVINRPACSAFVDVRWSIADDSYNSPAVHTSDHRVVVLDFSLRLY